VLAGRHLYQSVTLILNLSQMWCLQWLQVSLWWGPPGQDPLAGCMCIYLSWVCTILGFCALLENQHGWIPGVLASQQVGFLHFSFRVLDAAHQDLLLKALPYDQGSPKLCVHFTTQAWLQSQF
jgi:hypothetical protein